MEFEFDPQKSESNKPSTGLILSKRWRSKHVPLGAKDAFEKRYLVIGTITHDIGPRLSPIAERGFGYLLGKPLASQRRGFFRLFRS